MLYIDMSQAECSLAAAVQVLTLGLSVGCYLSQQHMSSV